MKNKWLNNLKRSLQNYRFEHLANVFTKQEQIVIFFFIGAVILGSGVQYFKERTAIGKRNFQIDSRPVKNDVLDKESFVFSKRLNKKININSDAVEELIKLPSIGPKLAERIINYRERPGMSFASIEDIKKVRGIGEKRWKNIRKHITVNEETTSP